MAIASLVVVASASVIDFVRSVVTAWLRTGCLYLGDDTFHSFYTATSR
ncbi:protein of unknown function [Xenorhabdus bovienii]|uniref:Uncharacterized protein n=1 Tax=Xenorhabdus bovienii TaxID=40576 RepID=A0A0B6X5H0_XENBV|nr:protein of unknown function [Xenorhabdus bovienii]